MTIMNPWSPDAERLHRMKVIERNSPMGVGPRYLISLLAIVIGAIAFGNLTVVRTLVVHLLYVIGVGFALLVAFGFVMWCVRLRRPRRRWDD